MNSRGYWNDGKKNVQTFDSCRGFFESKWLKSGHETYFHDIHAQLIILPESGQIFVVSTTPILKILFENEHFCAVFKPAAFLSVPSRTPDEDPRLVVGRILELQLGKRIWPCHRLDLDVSGILMFALNANAHKAANQWFESHQLRKSYQALATPLGPETHNREPQTWQCQLMRGKRRSYEAPFGKESVTIATYKGDVSLHGMACQHWTLVPKTGRPHQLRYEMMRHKTPIVGDKLYGSLVNFSEGGIALRAFQLDFSECVGARDFGLPPVLRLLPEMILV